MIKIGRNKPALIRCISNIRVNVVKSGILSLVVVLVCGAKSCCGCKVILFERRDGGTCVSGCAKRVVGMSAQIAETLHRCKGNYGLM